jgi:hypothetical protein
MTFSHPGILDTMKVGDVLYSLPTEKFPNGYAVEIATIPKSKDAFQSGEQCEIIPACIDEALVDYSEKVKCSADKNTGHSQIFDIADQMDSPLKSGPFGDTKFDNDFSMKFFIDHSRQDAQRLQKFEIKDDKIVLQYVLWDKDGKYQSTKDDQILIEIVLDYKVSDIDVNVNKNSQLFSMKSNLNYSATASLLFNLKGSTDKQTKKGMWNEFRKSTIGKKFTIARVPLITSPSNLVLAPYLDIFFELGFEVDGTIKVTAGVKDIEYKIDVGINKTLNTTNNTSITKAGDGFVKLEAEASATGTAGVGLGFTIEMPAFRALNPKHERCYVGYYGDYSATANLSVTNNTSLSEEAGLQSCFDAELSFKALPSIWGEYDINLHWIHPSGKFLQHKFENLSFESDILDTHYCFDWDEATGTTGGGSGDDDPDDPKEPKLYVSTTTLAFANTIINNTTTKTINVKNEGTADLIVTVSSNEAAFSVDWGTPNATIKPNETKKLTVTFKPTETKTYNGTIAITATNENNKKVEVKVSGIGINDPNEEVDLNAGLVAYYPFDGDCKDKSGLANHGVNYGAELTTGRKGQGNSAYKFNGAEYIEIPENDYFTFRYPPYSVSFWYLTNSLPSSSEPRNLFRMYGSSSMYYEEQYFRLTDNSNQWFYKHTVGYGKTGSIQTTQTPKANIWTHIVINITSQGIQIYLNGELIAVGGNLQIGYFTKYNITLGCKSHIGSLDDIRIYNRALNMSEVEALYKE